MENKKDRQTFLSDYLRGVDGFKIYKKIEQLKANGEFWSNWADIFPTDTATEDEIRKVYDLYDFNSEEICFFIDEVEEMAGNNQTAEMERGLS